MSETSAKTALVLATLLNGTMAGFFYAFSVSVMPGLDAARPAAAIEAMQEINRAIRNPVFFASFFLTPVVTAAAAALYWRAGVGITALSAALAALVYLAGAMAPTVLVNVPLNEALAAFPHVGGEMPAADAWRSYSASWTGWNTARAGFCLLAMLIVLAGHASETNAAKAKTSTRAPRSKPVSAAAPDCPRP